MAEGARSKVQHIVADSAAFLKNAPLHDMCENVYTVEELISEIRDAATRQRLSVLPYTLHLRQPSTEALHAVTAFSKLTGDYRSLSAVDLKVLALTYQLEKEHCGVDNIRTAPSKQVEISRGFTGKAVPGFIIEKKPKEESLQNEQRKEHSERSITESCGTDVKQTDGLDTAEGDIIELLKNEIASDKSIQSTATTEITSGIDTLSINNSVVHSAKDNDKGFGEVGDSDNNANSNDNDDHSGDDDNDDDDEDEDDDGWITPDNISRVKDEMGKGALDAVPANVTVGCLTTDFAMQNVLIQMGFHVISLDGLLIREARSYVLKCHACFRVTSLSGKKFCPSCGNNTLMKVSVSVDENGVTRYQVPSSKKPFNIRGKKFPLPLPEGGRHSNAPVLTEDQPRGQHRLPRNRDHVNVLDADYIARASPFAAKDVTSRASQLGYHLKGAHNTKNPNEVRKKNTRRKKK